MFYIATISLFGETEKKLGVAATYNGAKALIYLEILKSTSYFTSTKIESLISLIKEDNFIEINNLITGCCITETEYLTEKELLNNVKNHLNELLVKEIIK